MDAPGRLAGRTALVTGSSRGVGRAIAWRLVQEGARVAVNSRQLARAEKTATEIRDAGGEALGIAADVSRAADVDGMVSKIIQAWGSLDILVNNAGGWQVEASLDLDPRAWQRILDVNLTGAFWCAQRAARVMTRGRGGAIVNVSSVVADRPFPKRAAYSAAKAGLNSLTQVLALEWAPIGIRVNAVAPGFINTSFPDAPPPGADYSPEEIEARVPQGDWGRPEDVGSAVAFLVSDDARYVTGAVVYVDGGWSAHGGW